jgi:HEAT repeat protein
MRRARDEYARVARGYADLHHAKRDPNGLVQMLHRLRAEDSPLQLRVAVIVAMRRHGSSDRVMTSLVRTIRDASHWREREAAAYALSEIGTRRARVPLVIAMNDEDSRVRVRGERGIRRLESGNATHSRASGGSSGRAKSGSKARSRTWTADASS